MVASVKSPERSRRLGRLVRPDLLCGLAAVGVALVAVLASISAYENRLSLLVHMAANEPMAAIARSDPDFAYVDVGAHYDGVYFYAIAVDPFATGAAYQLLDRAPYRYGHPAYGWLAGILSLGQLELLPLALLVISLAGMFVAGVASSRLWSTFGWSAWGGLAVALNPGLVYAVTVDTTEAFGAALMMAALLAWAKRRFWLGAALLAVLCFTKEILILVPVGLLAWESIRAVGGRSDGDYRRRALLLLIGPVLYAGWYLYLDSRFGEWPYQQGTDILSLPLVGWLDSFRRAASLAQGVGDAAQVGQAAVALLTVALGAILLGMVRALRLRSLVDPMYLLMAGLILCTGWLAIMYPKDLIRTVAFVGLLLPLVLVDPRREV